MNISLDKESVRTIGFGLGWFACGLLVGNVVDLSWLFS